MNFIRASIFISILALAACTDNTPPVATFKPLDYSYLPPIMLKVATVNVVNNYVPDPGAATLLGEDPEPPANALLDMANRRLQPNGTPGSATFTLETASIEQNNGNLNGVMTVRLDVISADGRSKGYTEASVTHNATAPDSQDAMPAALYDMTKQLMDAMNVQLQYQIQQNLGSWVAYGNNAAAVPLITGTPAAMGAPVGAPMGTPMGAPTGSGAGPGSTISGGIQATPLDTPTTLPTGTQNLVPPSMAH